MEKSSTHQGLSEMAMEILSRKKPKIPKHGKSESKTGKAISKNGHAESKNGNDVSKNGSIPKGSSIKVYAGDPEVLDNVKLLNILMEVKSGNFNVKMPVDKT